MTLDELQTRRSAYMAAELKILQGQEYTISDGVANRQLRRADLAEVRAAIAEIEGQIALAMQAAVTRRIIYIR